MLKRIPKGPVFHTRQEIRSASSELSIGKAGFQFEHSHFERKWSSSKFTQQNFKPRGPRTPNLVPTAFFLASGKRPWDRGWGDSHMTRGACLSPQGDQSGHGSSSVYLTLKDNT